MKSLTLLLTLVCTLQASAGLTLSPMFGDHMVLQRDMPVPVWGMATPGDPVTVRFAGKEVHTRTADDGRWMLHLPAMPASAEGREFIVESKQTTTSFQDVLVGEVWICSGQSNMQYGWGKQSQARYNWGGDADLPKLAESAVNLPIRSFEVPPNVAFTPIAECAAKWSTNLPGSAVAFGFSYHLHKALDVPVAVIVTCWGSSYIEGWMPIELTAQLPHFKEIMDRFQQSEPARARVESAMEKGIRDGMTFVRRQPNILYNAMLHPLIPYGCRGIVWYQGEANSDQPELYAASLPAWIGELRNRWNRDDLHILAVMLPGYGEDKGPADPKSWAWFREAQAKGLEKIPHATLINTIDLSDAKDIHPPDKAPISERLALIARHDIHGEIITARGPIYQKHHIDGSTFTVTFDHAGGLTTKDDNPPAGFWLAGADQQWHSATATIQANTIQLTSPQVPAPVACRYAFSNTPTVNLINKAGLPAAPFRTDNNP
ncbi:MAG: sialate O-acetylesterase [Luteolibacter sp.]